MSEQIGDGTVPQEMQEHLQEETAEKSTNEVETQPEQQEVEQFEFEYGGQKKAVPKDKLETYVANGYHHSELNRKLKEDRAKFDDERQQWQQKSEELKEYQAVQEWAKQNPDLWEQARNAYQQNSGQAKPESDEVAALKQEISELKGHFKKYDTERGDALLAEEVDAVKQTFTDFDWQKTDEYGTSLLEKEVLEFANEKNIGFADAFKLMKFNEIAERKHQSGMEAALKNIEAKTKLGKLSFDPSTRSTTARESSGYKRGMSYDQLTRAALEEVGSV